MDFIDIFVIAIGLAMDASAVSLVAAVSGFANSKRATFRLAFHFGLFQFLMPLIGWYLGIHFVRYFEAFDHWIAFFLLFFVGIRMIKSGINPDIDKYKKDPTRGGTLVLLSVATSIDALAIGLTIGMLDVEIWYPAAIIGIVTSVLSLISIVIGKRVAANFGKRMEMIGGIILILIGVRILISHIFLS